MREQLGSRPLAHRRHAECPHGYFVERLLAVHQLEAPEDIVVIPPLEIGNLIHESVADLVTEFAGPLTAARKPG